METTEKYRCTTCQLIFDEPKIAFELDKWGKKILLEFCPRCSSVYFKPQEKVEGYIVEMVPTPASAKYTKLNEQSFNGLLSRFSPADLLLAIHLAVVKYKSQKGEVTRLDDHLWRLVTQKKSMRQF